ncbi:unnamed protein product [Dicrocoelium dendriticum]|nr:unnamed protein product [Dicrocoelium dendriticum]
MLVAVNLFTLPPSSLCIIHLLANGLWNDLREDTSHFSVAETFTFAHTPNSPRDTPVARELNTFPVRRDLIPCSLNPHSVSNRLTKSPTLSEVNRRSTWQSQPTSVEPNGKPELHLDALSDTSLKTPIHSRVSSAEHRTTSPSSSSLEKDLVETNGAQIQPVGTSKNSNVSSSSKLRDPRPYKCGTCQIGFRVPGHLHKHYRAKSHLVTVLNSHKLPPDTIDHIRHSRIGVSQVINPDNGQLRLRCIERLMSVKPPNTLNAAGSNHELPHRAK